MQSNCGKTHAIFRRCAFPSSATADPAGRAMAAAGVAAFCGLCAAGCFPQPGKRRCLSQRTVAGRKSRAARPRNGSARSVRHHDRHPGCGQPERGNAGQWLFEFITVVSKDIPSEGKAKVLLFRRDFLLFGTVVYNIWTKRVGDLDYESINFCSKVRYTIVTAAAHLRKGAGAAAGRTLKIEYAASGTSR